MKGVFQVKKGISLVLMLFMVFLSIGALAEPGVTVTDGMGREVTIAKVPEKVVSLTAANTEILFALGVGEKVIGIDAFSDYPPEVSSVPSIVGDYSGPNVELIVSLAPDVVFASTKLQTDVISKLHELGITVVCNDPTSYAEIYTGIQLIADAMQADATGLLASMKEKETQALANVESAEPVKVYFALSFGEYGNWSVGKGTFIDDMISMLGGTNVAASAPVSWPEYSIEQLILDDPDIILVSANPGEDDIVQRLSAADGYKDLRCVKEGKVFAVDANTSNRPGPRIVEALQAFAEAIR